VTDGPSGAHHLAKAHRRANILVALERAGDAWPQVLKVISDSEDSATARLSVAQALGLDEVQANAVLDMQFRRVTRIDRDRIREELSELRSEIQRLTDNE